MENVFSCYIVDDEDYALDRIKQYVERIPSLKVIGSNNDPIEAVKELNQGLSPDILFLDINMPKLSGLTVLDMLSKDVSVIFTTGELRYALDAFEKNAAEFLLKPFNFEKFEKVVLKVQGKMASAQKAEPDGNGFIFINSGKKGKLIKIILDDIIFIESLNHYLHVQTIESKHITYLTMNEVLESLPKSRFIRVHKSFIINFDKLKEVTASQVMLTGEYYIPIGSNFKSNLMKLIPSSNHPSRTVIQRSRHLVSENPSWAT